ncbi:MAG: hypothetical protein D8M54_23755 [Chloroflexi bacterium]|nr:hypothetical protein [Chloroflexota bacterium]
MDAKTRRKLVNDIRLIPDLAGQVLEREAQYEEVARALMNVSHCLYLAGRQRPAAPPILVTFADVKVASINKEEGNSCSLPITPSPKQAPYRPAGDHPWKRNIWPTKEAWRWNG